MFHSSVAAAADRHQANSLHPCALTNLPWFTLACSFGINDSRIRGMSLKVMHSWPSLATRASECIEGYLEYRTDVFERICAQ